MSEQTKTPWRKNLDKRYICGEDLLLELNGLRKQMIVCLESQIDAPAFDQKTQSEVIKSALWLKDLETGKKVYKPCLLNVGRAEFLTKESGGSIYMEDWYGLTFVMYAKPDKRHGHIVAFKKYYPPAEIKPDEALLKLSGCKVMSDLLSVWESLSVAEKKLPAVLSKKEELKLSLPKETTE